MTVEQARSELGVPPGASELQVRRAFKTLALRYHPDRNAAQPDASARFRRVLLAYEILSGPRAPTPSAPHVEPTPQPRPAPAQRPAWEMPFVEVLPLQTPDGKPIHYPTPEEIRKLDSEDPSSPRKMMTRLLLIFIGFVALVWVLALLDQRPPPAPDPLRDKLRKSMGTPW